MKQLYLNNKRAIIDDETYFPFTQKVGDMEDISIIGLVSTKSVDIPRCTINDDILGYVGQITRVVTNYTTDNLIGISFNQTKKCTYTLYDNGRVISSGIIKIINITELSYTIEFYDELIEKIETLRGDEETGEGYLNELDLILSDNSTFSLKATNVNVRTLNTDTSEVRPLFNIGDYESTGNQVRIKYVPTSGSAYDSTLEIPEDITPIQFRGLKVWEMDYAVPVSTVIRSINETYDIITVDPLLSDLFDEVHMNLGKPAKTLTTTNYTSTGGNLLTYSAVWNGSNYVWSPTSDSEIHLLNGTTELLQENGTYRLRVPFTMTFDIHSSIPTGTDYLSVMNGVQYYSSVAFGTKFAELFVNVYIASYDDGFPNFRTTERKIKLNLYADQNAIITRTPSGQATKVTLTDVFEIEYDYYPNFGYFNNQNYIRFDFDPMWENSNLFRKAGWSINVYPYPTTNTTVGTIDINYSTLDFKTGDTLKGQTMFPKISIHQFIIDVAKAFNLGLMVVNNKIYIHKKNYTITSDILQIDEINSIDVHNFDFSRLILTTNNNDSAEYKSYQDYTNKVYGQQAINTGYNIKRNTKTINFEIGVPGIIRDYNYYAYSTFCDYGNGGYSRVLNGITQGLEDSITLGYIHKNLEDVCFLNDSEYEGGLVSGEGTPEEVKFVLTNTLIKYYQSTGKYVYPVADAAGQSRLADHHYTLLPYKFDSGYNVLASMEMNKPDYNFANVTDALYPVETTLYQRFHKKVVSDIYNVNTHILDAKIWIDGPLDVYSIYNYKNTNYVIIDIPEYDPTTPSYYDIKLLRVNDIANYELTPPPVIYLIDGSLSFESKFTGDMTAYQASFTGFACNVLLKEDGLTNFEQIDTIVPENKTFQYVSGTNKSYVRQTSDFGVTTEKTLAYLKTTNNLFYYKQSGVTKVYYAGDSSTATLNLGTQSGNVVSVTANSSLMLTTDTRTIGKLITREFKLGAYGDTSSTVIPEYTDGGQIVELFFDYRTEDGSEPFGPNGALAPYQIIITYAGDNYVLTDLQTEGNPYLSFIEYYPLSGGYLNRCHLKVNMYTGVAPVTYGDITVRLENINYADGDYTQVLYKYSPDGTFGSNTVNVYGGYLYNNSGSVNYSDIPFTITGDSYNTYHYYTFTNNGTPPVTVTLETVKSDYQTNYALN